jgi:hypothetical protein
MCTIPGRSGSPLARFYQYRLLLLDLCSTNAPRSEDARALALQQRMKHEMLACTSCIHASSIGRLSVLSWSSTVDSGSSCELSMESRTAAHRQRRQHRYTLQHMLWPRCAHPCPCAAERRGQVARGAKQAEGVASCGCRSADWRLRGLLGRETHPWAWTSSLRQAASACKGRCSRSRRCTGAERSDRARA